MSVAFTKRLATPSHVLTRRLDDELVLLNLDNECYFGLDEVSTRIWDVLSSSPSIEAGIERLLAEFEVEPQRLRADVEAFLSQLLDSGLVELPDV
jgi:hypothetical protein